MQDLRGFSRNIVQSSCPLTFNKIPGRTGRSFELKRRGALQCTGGQFRFIQCTRVPGLLNEMLFKKKYWV